MGRSLRITLAQIRTTMGDVAGNAGRLVAIWEQARAAGSALVLAPEMALAGGPAGDLAADRGYLAACAAALDDLARRTGDGPALGVGAPAQLEDGLFNVYHLLQRGTVSRIRKHRLAGSPLDEARRFRPGPISGPCRVAGVRIGFALGEDALDGDVAEALLESGAELLLVPAAFPYRRDGFAERQQAMIARVIETGLPLACLNAVGSQDALGFDGASFALNPGGRLMAQLPMFEESITHLDLEEGTDADGGWLFLPADRAALPAGSLEQDYRVLVESLRDYLRVAGIDHVLLGLSGGMDSALVATVAADALGPQRVRGVLLPSRYTSDASTEDAAELAARLGIRTDTLPITPGQEALTATLAPLFAGRAPDLTEENLQARLRGVLLMALSNKFGGLLLSTGNKSEGAVGYATLYGDTCGGWNPLKDLYKTRVYALARWRNGAHRDWMLAPAGAVIPQRVLDKPPSAELRPDQKDADSLPPYDVLDPILEGLLERDRTPAELVAEGQDAATVARVAQLMAQAEYKRAQTCPGPRLTACAFGPDRHFPIANRWRGGG